MVALNNALNKQANMFFRYYGK